MSVADHNLLGADSKQTKLFKVNQIVMFPSYVSRQLADDIALINQDQAVQWSDRIQPACLPNPDNIHLQACWPPCPAGAGRTKLKTVFEGILLN